MSGITTHVLDLANGVPAEGVAVRLERLAESGGWVTLAEKRTDADGRVRDLWTDGPEAARYRLTFGTGEYWSRRAKTAFHPEVAITFEIHAAGEHYHVPLLLSPFGYSTYRGS